MSDSLKRTIKKKIETYSKLLGIQDYSYTTDFINSKKKKSTDEYDLYATVDIDEETRDACIEINKKLLLKKRDELDNTVIHELLHVRMHELIHLMTMIVSAHVKDKKSKKVYLEQIDNLEHKIIVPLANALVKKCRTR